MPDSVLDSDASTVAPSSGGFPLTGVAVAEVINNLDETNLGRVQVSLPWLPGIQPWARVAAGSGGANRGTYFIPQVGEEVLVAFQHGDIRDAYILGSLWNRTDRPPSTSLLDPVNRRVIKTPVGHVIELDDQKQSVSITTATGHSITMDPDQIQITTAEGTAKLVLDATGSISLEADIEITFKAPSITFSADSVEIDGDASIKLSSSGVCQIQGGLVQIN